METSSVTVTNTAFGSVMVHMFNQERFDRFLGRVLTLAETLGLPQTQEEAYKSLIKQEVWDLWEHPWGIEEKESNF